MERLFVLRYSTGLLLVMQKAVEKHSALLQRELDHLKTKLNARSNRDLLAPDQSCKLNFFYFFKLFVLMLMMYCVLIQCNIFKFV